jgi:sporulation protein YlmC with PRC-barrel domain
MENKTALGAGTLTGDRVRNMQGEDLGKVDEIMLDVNTGCVSYVVLSQGGFLGMGEKLFAIPWKAMTLDMDNHEFVLDISRERLENAPGFDKTDWPDFSSEQYEMQIYDYYGLTRPSRMFSGTGSGMSEGGMGTGYTTGSDMTEGGMGMGSGSHTTGTGSGSFTTGRESGSFSESDRFTTTSGESDSHTSGTESDTFGGGTGSGSFTTGTSGHGAGTGSGDFSTGTDSGTFGSERMESEDCEATGLTAEEREACYERKGQRAA